MTDNKDFKDFSGSWQEDGSSLLGDDELGELHQLLEGEEIPPFPDEQAVESREVPRQRQESRPAIRATGTVWMNQSEDDGTEFDRETAERWVRGMEGTDPNHPRGGKWTAEALKPLAQKNGFPTDGPEFWEFYAMANAMYSDYAATAKRYGISTPEFYAELARDFIHDADAEPDKVERYYKYIARK